MHEKQNIQCPACDKGSLREARGSEDLSYNGKSFVLSDFVFSICDNCGTEIVLPEQAHQNDRLIREEHRRIDGLLTAEEIRELRAVLKLTQQDASSLFGGGANAFSKYERSEVIQSVAMDRLLRIVATVPGAYHALIQIAFGSGASFTVAKASEHVVGCDYAECVEDADSMRLPISRSRPNLRLVKKSLRENRQVISEKYGEIAANG